MNTLHKHTFADGSFVELYQRKDNTHRIKYTSNDGDELCLNLATKGWCKGTETLDYNILFSLGRDFMTDRGVASSDDAWLGVHVAAAILTRMGPSVKEAARVYGQHPETCRVYNNTMEISEVPVPAPQSKE